MQQTRPPAFVYKKDILHADKLSLEKLAERYGTPLYVYSGTAIRERFRTFDSAFKPVPHTICYSVKANSNLSLLGILAKLGAGFDVVSGGELERVLAAGKAAAKKVVFSGVGKTAEEMALALKSDILIFNVESEAELDVLAATASRLKKRARMALRVNPDVFAETHPYISTGLREHKFGVGIDQASRLYHAAARQKYLEVAGVSVHIGSQITSVEPFAAAMARVADLVRALRMEGMAIRFVDAGGGLGISYTAQERTQEDFSKQSAEYAKAVMSALQGLGVHLLLEPGRSIVAPAGLLLARVIYKKRNGAKTFIIVDAAMNDLIRPSLYKAHHEIVPVAHPDAPPITADIVGPVCETGDFFARDRAIPECTSGDLLAILDAGAYGMALASNYNTRPRPAEVLVEGSSVKVVRKRETVRDLIKAEL